MWRLLFCLAVVVSFAAAIFEDQLGNVDWHRRGVGAIVQATLHARKPRLLATTDARVLTHLHSRDGAVQWRQKLDTDVVALYASQHDNTALTLGAQGRLLRCWSQIDGTLKWQHLWTEPIAAMKFEDGPIPKLLYLKGMQLERRDALDGVGWSTKVETLMGCHGVHHFSEGGAQMTLISLCKGRRVLLTRFDVETGKGFFTKEYSVKGKMEWDVGEVAVGVMEEQLVLAKGTERCQVDLAGPSTDIVCQKTSHTYTPLKKTLLEMNHQDGEMSIQEWKDAEWSVLLKIENYLVHSPIQSSTDYDFMAIVSKPSDSSEGLQINAVDALTGSSLHTEIYTQLPKDFEIERAFLGTYASKNASIGFRYAEMYLLQQGQIVWERNEALSGVTAAMFVDPPTHKTGIEADPAKWIQSQILALKVQFKLSTPEDVQQLAQLKSDLSGKNLAVKDASGYRKFIVALTKYNSVVAVHNGDGHIIWQTKLPPSLMFDGLTLWSYSHQEDTAPMVLLYRKGTEAHFAVIDAHSGAMAFQKTLPQSVSKIVKLQHPVRKGWTEQAVLAMIDMTDRDAPTGCLVPSEDASAVQEAIQNIIFWEIDRARGIARGYGVRQVDLSNNRLTFGIQWSLDFHATVLSVSERGADDPVHSYTKVLGDRSLLFKYLNPNMALIVTGDGGSEFDDACLDAYVIDTVTGRILFRQNHESAKGPVHSVISQHWAVYHYWSISNQRFQMSTLELYDASHRQLTVSDLLLGGLRQERISSYDPIPVKAFNATFFVSSGVKSLAVTKTLKGITTQMLLMATISDQVYAMNKRFLDPRRPIRPNQQSKEERLLPYNENLPVIPTHFVSYNHEILGIKGMMTAPAGLESAIHLFVFGEDLFYNRLQPERGFDTLDEDFNYGFLILTLVAMLVASIVCHYMMRKAKLAQKWK